MGSANLTENIFTGEVVHFSAAFAIQESMQALVSFWDRLVGHHCSAHYTVLRCTAQASQGRCRCCGNRFSGPDRSVLVLRSRWQSGSATAAGVLLRCTAEYSSSGHAWYGDTSARAIS